MRVTILFLMSIRSNASLGAMWLRGSQTVHDGCIRFTSQDRKIRADFGRWCRGFRDSSIVRSVRLRFARGGKQKKHDYMLGWEHTNFPRLHYAVVLLGNWTRMVVFIADEIVAALLAEMEKSWHMPWVWESLWKGSAPKPASVILNCQRLRRLLCKH